ncbi:DNA polymerase III subunit chi [Ramlibacter sp. AN1015]|uniref:DNA polymerase III subunit chi n=1 Tax=Ramlibacter sp. AN1015 TaxID=3133428 RepID=UPI0030BC8471
MTTQVAFHFNASAKVGYSCRLLRKAVASGARVVVCGDVDLLRELDLQLWTFSALDFVAHCRADDAPPHVLARSPVVLTEPAHAATAAPHREVLVNIAERVPTGFEQFARVIEVVTDDADDRQRARARWKQYAGQGFAIERHDLAESR